MLFQAQIDTICDCLQLNLHIYIFLQQLRSPCHPLATALHLQYLWICTGSHNCQYKPSGGKSCQRSLEEQGEETDWGVWGSSCHLAYCHNHPSHASSWLPKPWQCGHCRYSYTKSTTPLPGSLSPPSLCLYLFFNSSLFLLQHLRSG